MQFKLPLRALSMVFGLGGFLIAAALAGQVVHLIQARSSLPSAPTQMLGAPAIQ